MNASTLPLQTQLQPRSRALPHHCESNAMVSAPANVLFEYADDHEHLASHMSQSSWMMGNGRMTTEMDAGRGQWVGSEIRLSGRVLGMQLYVAEKITERDPPRRKVWETTVRPRLLIVGHYRMGFEIASRGTASQFRVFIDYALPESVPARWLGRLFGRFYARWCTQQMVDGVSQHFSRCAKAHRSSRPPQRRCRRG
jgi:hypothetical protein